MSTEIIPPGASVVITDHGDKHQHNNHPNRYEITKQVEDIARDSTRQKEDNFKDSTRQREDDFKTQTRQLEVSATADALASAHSDEESQENFAIAQKQLSDAATSSVMGFKDAAATAFQLQVQKSSSNRC
jgi:hypothetical protein